MEQSAAGLHHYKMRVRYDDIDSVGHVGHKSYLAFLQEARLDYLERIGGFTRDGMGIGYLVARIEVDYLAPLFYGNTVEVRTRCTRIGRKSFTLSSEIVHTSGAAASREAAPTGSAAGTGAMPGSEEQVCARAAVVMVCVDPKTGRSREHDQETVDAIRDI